MWHYFQSLSLTKTSTLIPCPVDGEDIVPLNPITMIIYSDILTNVILSLVCNPQVVIGGRNKYLINGSNANNSRVQDLFCSVQLNVNNPHFLIMQVSRGTAACLTMLDMSLST